MTDQLTPARTFIPTPVPEPLPLVESLVDDVLDELDEMGTSLGTASSDELFEARYSALADLLHTDRDPFGSDLVAIAYTLQTLARVYELHDVQEPAQFPDCATTLTETFRSGLLWHHLEAAVTAELSGEAHG
ncbi:hypothetical protein [Halorarius halobius]|uniref:hypothetical protein n=1 Tax=Halorarius halobius TaxID=2962671 RepID=UPI0020CDA241|nr:hypothetical protein [Halorarius halobius]